MHKSLQEVAPGLRPVDYRSGPLAAPDPPRVRPRRWLSHMRTAGFLCLAALFVDGQRAYDAAEARSVMRIEVLLALYGMTCAIVSLVRGALSTGDRVAVAVCVLLFAFTACVGAVMPRVIHN